MIGFLGGDLTCGRLIFNGKVMRDRFLQFLILAILSAAGSSVHAGSVTGSWSWTGSAEESGRFLSTIQTGSKVKFQLELYRGAPSYNSGFIEGEFELKGNKGVFLTADDEGTCEITFIFSPKQVMLSESPNKNYCGFGYGVYAEGQLKLDSRKRPTMSDGDPREGTILGPVKIPLDSPYK